MENLFKPTDILTYNQLMQWDKNDLAEFILNNTYIKYTKNSLYNDELPMDKIIASI